MLIIPNQSSKKHLQDNKTDLSGTIYQSKNINLDVDGYIKLADATFAQWSTADDADFANADAILASDDDIYINSTEVFRGDAGVTVLSNRSTDTDVPTPGREEDVEYFNNTEVVSDGTNVYYRSDTAEWTAVSVSGGSFSTSSPTCMTVWDGENSLAVGNTNQVKFINTSWAVNGTVLTLPPGYKVMSMTSIGNTLFIATRNDGGQDSKFFTVNSIATSADYAYPTGSFELASIKTFQSSVVGINSLGQLIRFNGGGFDVLATLPVYQTDVEWADANNDYSKVSNRGMTVDGDLIYINLSAIVEAGRFKILPGFQSGVWCYDNSNGSFYHKYSPSFSTVKRLESLTVSVANNTFTGSAGDLDGSVTGMPVFYEATAAAAPLMEGGRCYYLIKDSSSVFKLADTYADALAGTPIDITSEGTDSDFFIIRTNDYGWTWYDTRSTVLALNSKLFDDNYVGRICMTANLEAKQAIDTDMTVFCPTSPYIPNRGYFITPRLNSSVAKDNYNTFSLKFKPLDTDDKIIVKYKTKDRFNFPRSSVAYSAKANWEGIWTSTTAFTTIADLSDVVAGDEIELIAGVGAGHIANISTITEDSGTYTVTLDEAFPFAVADDEFYFNMDTWKKLATIDNTNVDNLYQTTIDNQGKFIQFKIEMRGIGITIEELQIDNKTNLPTQR